MLSLERDELPQGLPASGAPAVLVADPRDRDGDLVGVGREMESDFLARGNAKTIGVSFDEWVFALRQRADAKQRQEDKCSC